VDTEKVSQTTPFLHVTWSALLQVWRWSFPFDVVLDAPSSLLFYSPIPQIFANLGLLIYFIGWSALTGFALLIITIPTQVKDCEMLHPPTWIWMLLLPALPPPFPFTV
jgi:hypothetical protein